MPGDPPMPDARFVAVPGLRVVNYAEESVVFNDATWETHVLNASAAEVLAMCIDAPIGLTDVTQALAHWLAADETGASREHAARIVEELQTLGLVTSLAAAPPR